MDAPMLRDHLREYVERNGEDASYEAWIATVHPENVRLDDRLRLPQSEHRAMWEARPRVTTASRQASGGGLVALLALQGRLGTLQGKLLLSLEDRGTRLLLAAGLLCAAPIPLIIVYRAGRRPPTPAR